MKATRGLWLHVGLFGVAAIVALATASIKSEPSEGKRVEAELWPGPPSAVRQITFESEGTKATVVPARDSVGQYAVVEATKEASKHPQSDAGTSSAKPPETKRFIAVDEAEKLLTAIAPAKSYRSLGKLEPTRLADYGLDKPESKITATIGEKTYRLDIGALTPGSGDHYVRDPDTGLVHTFTADVIGKLKFSESRLLEHELHGFPADQVRSIEIAAGGKTRKLVRVEGKPNAWADAATPTAVDETVGNWLLKVQRLRPQNYLEKPANVASTAIVRIVFHDQKRKLGYFELFRCTDAEKKYVGRSERSRWYVEVPPTSAEPVEQDIAAIVK
jgi:hypothetical protein